MEANKPLPIQTAFNVRELGGYINKENKILKKGRFIRSGGISELNEEDCEYLYNYGIRTVIDLRSESERSVKPDRLNNYKDVKNYAFSLSDDAEPSKMQTIIDATMDHLYCRILDKSQKMIGDILKIMLASEGSVLFHCTAGKDRTGVLAMLLLKLADVDEDTIINDYAASYQNLLPIINRLQQSLADIHMKLPLHVFESDPENMRKTLAYFNQRYSIRGYLTSAGLSEEEIDALRSELV